jgi:excisionase family DNA binding protein
MKLTSPLLDTEQAAAHLGVTVGTLNVWRSTGRHQLPYLKIGRNVRYRLSDLDVWLEARLRTSV